ncbi:hypothetical protein HDA45_003049 [Amycolatopsis umgeniensis]|uniref:Uncharacterized protein n=1 Tax=Amycolatopsis umgeniensis TaxID=336628 RepID=A0A841B2Y1_9PSEU|nr:hypothetical protein [Amycolatopsis umgeniensis]
MEARQSRESRSQHPNVILFIVSFIVLTMAG